MKKLDGQIVIITGGARGIGEGICKIFCNEGATVALWDVLEGGQKTANVLVLFRWGVILDLEKPVFDPQKR